MFHATSLFPEISRKWLVLFIVRLLILQAVNAVATTPTPTPPPFSPPAIGGKWLNQVGQAYSIQQTGMNLNFIAPSGQTSSPGSFLNPIEIIARNWNNRIGVLNSANNRISWSNGGIWTLVTPTPTPTPFIPPGINGSWKNETGAAVSIQQSGISLIFHGPAGQSNNVSKGIFLTPAKVIAYDWSNRTGMLNTSNNKISWSNGGTWTLVKLIPTPTPTPLPTATPTPTSAPTPTPQPALIWPTNFSTTAPQLLTQDNRHASTAMGGWGEQLRSLMYMSNGDEWFAAESGTNVMVNSSMMYYKKVGGVWINAGSVALFAGIQENMAVITDGRIIYVYGISNSYNELLECWFDTQNPGFLLNTCNLVPTGVNLASSNYIGAAYRQDRTRIVWWTHVVQGGQGTFSSTYNRQGTGWVGPFTSTVPNSSFAGYLFGQFDAAGSYRAVGEFFLGKYPTGTYAAGLTTITTGQVATWQTIPGVSSTDLWVEPVFGATHVLIQTSSGINYMYSPPGSWPQLTQYYTFAAAYRMRFAYDGTYLYVIRDDATNQVFVINRFSGTTLDQPLGFDTADKTTIPRPTELSASGWATAIYVVDQSKQPPVTGKRDFAICGSYPISDGKIFHYPVQ